MPLDSDTGCEFSSSCFTCPLPKCRHDYPFQVEHYLTLVGRSLGIEYEDLFNNLGDQSNSYEFNFGDDEEDDASPSDDEESPAPSEAVENQ